MKVRGDSSNALLCCLCVWLATGGDTVLCGACVAPFAVMDALGVAYGTNTALSR